MKERRITKISKTLLKGRNEIHIARKLLHVIGVGFILLCYHYLSLKESIFFLALAVVVTVTVDYLRKRLLFLQDFVINIFGQFMRKQELHQLSGLSWLLLGTLIIVILFPVKIVTLSLLMLAIGDPICNLVGIKYGKDKLIEHKSFQGTFAGFVACSIVSAIYFMFMEIMLDRWILVSLLSGFIGAFAEAVPINIDDNFIIPVVNAILLWGLFAFFGG